MCPLRPNKSSPFTLLRPITILSAVTSVNAFKTPPAPHPAKIMLQDCTPYLPHPRQDHPARLRLQTHQGPKTTSVLESRRKGLSHWAFRVLFCLGGDLRRPVDHYLSPWKSPCNAHYASRGGWAKGTAVGRECAGCTPSQPHCLTPKRTTMSTLIPWRAAC